MAGVGKLLKQAQKMQKQVEAVQAGLAEKEFEVTSGGGAVTVRVNGQGEFLGIKLDPDFLKEEASLVEESVLTAIQDAARKAKSYSEEEMQKVTSGFPMPGMF